MSPLIATVLLIAFAVALGAMIMNWSSGLEEGNPEEPVSTNPCENVRLELANADPMFCYQEDMIKFRVVNAGTKKIDAVLVRTFDQNGQELNTVLPQSIVQTGQTFAAELPFDKEGLIHVELIPRVVTSSGENLCTGGRLVQDILPDCQ